MNASPDETIFHLYQICAALERRYPGNRDPFRILARLMEESGELADQVHLFENIGRKRQAGRQPDEQELVKEIKQVLVAALDIARYYGIEQQLAQNIHENYLRALAEGLVAAPETPPGRAMHPDQPARIAIQGLAYDAGSSYQRGPALAPPLIRQALYSGSANLWSENGTDLAAPGLIADQGDLAPSPGQDYFDQVTQATAGLLAQGLRLLSLGGDHSVTFPVVRALAAQSSRLSILHFDAHPDLYDEYEGNPHSHACPFARIMEAGLAQRLVQIGIRTLNGHQRQQAQRFGVEIIAMPEWRDDLRFEFDTPLYISFDMDCLDPAFAPGVSHWEPGGFSTRQVLRVIQTLRAPTIAGADLVEFNPQVEAGRTAMTAAKVLKELAAKMLAR